MSSDYDPFGRAQRIRCHLYETDGSGVGGLFDPVDFKLHCKSWHGKPHPHFEEVIYVGDDGFCVLYRQARKRHITGSVECGDLFDSASSALGLTAAAALAWFAEHGYQPPAELRALARAQDVAGGHRSNGQTPPTHGGGAGKPATPTGEFTPLDQDLSILEALAKRKARTKTDALGVRGVGARLIKERLPLLEKYGLVDRNDGIRRGWAITAKGRDLCAVRRT